jgi:hypothetical protein
VRNDFAAQRIRVGNRPIVDATLRVKPSTRPRNVISMVESKRL